MHIYSILSLLRFEDFSFANNSNKWTRRILLSEKTFSWVCFMRFSLFFLFFLLLIAIWSENSLDKLQIKKNPEIHLYFILPRTQTTKYTFYIESCVNVIFNLPYSLLLLQLALLTSFQFDFICRSSFVVSLGESFLS